MKRTGRLPQGIVIDGALYQDYELREQIVGDEIEIMESDYAPRAMKNDSFFGVCVMARRLTLTGLDKPVTPEMVMGMTQSDFVHLIADGKKQDSKRASFRDAAEAAPDALSGIDENRV